MIAKKRKVKHQTGKHTGVVKHATTFAALEVHQTATTLYLLTAPAAFLFAALSISRRFPDKDEGYQRTLSLSRVDAITRYIKRKRPIPGAITVCFDKATFDKRKGELTVPAGTDVGWVIDGQHRLAGAHLAAESGTAIELPVVAFIGLSVREQIEQFITINKEARNVPTSLYLDLLHVLPTKKPGELAQERAVDLASSLRRDHNSPFFDRIVVTTSPKPGQISLTNFVRKISPHVTPDKGMLHLFTHSEQMAVVSNYYKGLRQVFPKEFDAKDSLFFKTVGFGAMWNAFPAIFTATLKHKQGFRVSDVIAIFQMVGDFDFSAWRQYGTGNQAETNAGDDLKAALAMASTKEGSPGLLRL